MKPSLPFFTLAGVALAALSCDGSGGRQEPAQAARLHDACSNDAFCAPSRLVCHVALGCVQCLTNAGCDAGTLCSSEGVCVASQACVTTSDCGGGYCVNGICNDCLSDADCNGQLCQQGVCRVANQPIVVPGEGAPTGVAVGTAGGAATGTATGAAPTGTGGGGTTTGTTTTGTATGAGGTEGTTTGSLGGANAASGASNGGSQAAGGTSAGGTTSTAGTSSGGASGGDVTLPTVPAGAQTYSFSLSNLNESCWEGESAPYSTTTPIQEVRLAILTSGSQDVDFDFCIYRATMVTGSAVVDLTWGENAWMAADYGANATVGVAGPWFSFHDDAGSTITGSSATGFEGLVAAGEPVCVSGTSAEAIDDDFGTYWGNVVAFQPNGADGPANYVPADYGVDTIRVVIAGNDIPTTYMRFGVATSADVEYCSDTF